MCTHDEWYVVVVAVKVQCSVIVVGFISEFA